MGFKDVKEWLDYLISLEEASYNARNFNNEIYANHISPAVILIGKGIEIIADVLGYELTESYEKDDSTRLNYTYEFEYGEYTIRQYEEESILKNENTLPTVSILKER